MGGRRGAVGPEPAPRRRSVPHRGGAALRALDARRALEPARLGRLGRGPAGRLPRAGRGRRGHRRRLPDAALVARGPRLPVRAAADEHHDLQLGGPRPAPHRLLGRPGAQRPPLVGRRHPPPAGRGAASAGAGPVGAPPPPAPPGGRLPPLRPRQAAGRHLARRHRPRVGAADRGPPAVRGARLAARAVGPAQPPHLGHGRLRGLLRVPGLEPAAAPLGAGGRGPAAPGHRHHAGHRLVQHRDVARLPGLRPAGRRRPGGGPVRPVGRPGAVDRRGPAGARRRAGGTTRVRPASGASCGPASRAGRRWPGDRGAGDDLLRRRCEAQPSRGRRR